jgi:ribonuclease-3
VTEPEPDDRSAALQARLLHPFSDPELLQRALTHRSWANEHDGADNERLEFLGDAVLSAAITPLLLERYPDAREGQLARLRSRLVRTATLAAIAREIGLGDALRLGRGEEASGGRDRDSVLEDALEAVVGAVFVDGGFEPARALVLRWFEGRVRRFGSEVNTWNDPVSALQELTQERDGETPRYVDLSSSGPDHEPRFEVAVYVGERRVATGVGRRKKTARRAAADAALRELGQ